MPQLWYKTPSEEGICSKHGGHRKCIQILARKTSGKKKREHFRDLGVRDGIK